MPQSNEALYQGECIMKKIMNWLEEFFTIEIDPEPFYSNDWRKDDDIVEELESGYQYIMF